MINWRVGAFDDKLIIRGEWKHSLAVLVFYKKKVLWEKKYEKESAQAINKESAYNNFLFHVYVFSL